MREGIIIERSDGYFEVISSDGQTRPAFWIGRRLKYCVVLRTRDVVAIRCTISDEKVLIVPCYFSPSEDIVPVVTQLTGLVGKYPNDNILVVGEFNAKLSIGGGGSQRIRGVKRTSPSPSIMI